MEKYREILSSVLKLFYKFKLFQKILKSSFSHRRRERGREKYSKLILRKCLIPIFKGQTIIYVREDLVRNIHEDGEKQ